MTRLFFSALVALLIAGPGAAWVQAANREHQQMMADIRMLQMQTQELEAMLTTLVTAVDRVTAKIDEHATVDRKAFADSKLMVDTIATGIRILREKVDDTNVRVSSFSQEIEALRLAIPRMPIPATAPAADETTGGPPVDNPAPPPPAPLNPGVSPQRLYDNAWADYTTGQWALAITGFEAYIKAFPRSASADDAQFYIGQTYYNDGRFDEAVAAFDLVIANYPQGNAVPEAYYKRGLALDRLGATDRARESFQTVIAKYPDDPMASLAKQALDRLSRPSR